MMTIKKYIPNFFTGVEDEISQFNTLKELKEVPFVKRMMNLDNFFKLSLSNNNKILLAEFDSGKKWYVVGFIDNYQSNLTLSICKYGK